MVRLLSSGLILILLCMLTAWYLSNKFGSTTVQDNVANMATATSSVSAVTGGNISSLPHFSYTDSRINIPDAEGFGFEKSSDKLVAGNGADIYWQEIANSLSQNKGKKLYLQGSYAGGEKNSSKYANLGVARAEAIKQKLITMGAPAASMITSGVKNEGAFFMGNTYVGGVNFFTQMPAIPTTAPDEKKESLAKNETGGNDFIQPLNIYYSKNEKAINMTPQIRSYFDNLKTYLDKHPEAKVSILGFTDNQGDSLKNVELSLHRAEEVRDFMLTKKFDTARLVLRGKGSLRPIGSNDTEIGRAQNRRVEVRLMYN